jgi:hypothetical protein
MRFLGQRISTILFVRVMNDQCDWAAIGRATLCVRPAYCTEGPRHVGQTIDALDFNRVVGPDPMYLSIKYIMLT